MFLEALGLGPGITWDRVLQVAVELFGRPIHLIVDSSADLRSVTGVWAATDRFGVIITRAQDDEHYRLVSQLHEISHVLTSYAPAGMVESLIRVRATVRFSDRIIRMCSATDSSAPGEARELERFVEDIALELEHFMRSPRTLAEAHL